MNPIMCILAFLGSIVAYCAIVLALYAIISGLLKHESLTDEDFWSGICTVQFGIVLVVLALYYSNMTIGVS